MNEVKKKAYTPAQAWVKIQDWCAYQERSQQEVRDKLYEYGLHQEDVENLISEVRDKLYEYGLHQEDVENLISRLIAENFINEERFARAYAGGKFRIKKWGRNKIKAGLRAKKISEYCLKLAMEEIDEREYRKTLKKLLSDKEETLKERNHIRKKYKLLTYAASKGFEQALIMEILNEDD